MKLKTIAAVFKRNKNLKILTMPNGTQWITNGVAMYSMSGMPELTPATVLKIFDIPNDKQGEWNCEVKPMPENMCKVCTNDFYTTESLLEPKKSTIEYGGITYSLLRNNDDIIAIDEKYLKPLYDDMEYMQFYKQEFPDKCGFAIVCQNALELEAVIMPIVLAEEMAKELFEIGMYFNSARYKSFSENMRKPVIQSIPIDTETGEVLDEKSEYTQETFIKLYSGSEKDGTK